ncbi:MAG: ABC transporter substrate-binding protein [Clostridia bacterium]|nr:ABC transporter substrate-binding protein [Clostridia bacterium]
MKKIISSIMMIMIMSIAVTGCGKSDEEKVTFVLDWTPNTNHTGVYVALENGYFAEAGLDVEIIQPADGTAEQLVASGTAQFGISYQENVTFARAQGMPLVSIAAVIQHNTSGFMSFKDEGITSPLDFAGKKYGGWGTDVETTTVRHLIKTSGGDPGSVDIVTMGSADFFAAADAGEIDFAWVFEGWTLMEARIRGLEVNYFAMIEYSDIFDYYTPVIITSEDTIEKNDGMVGRFMKAVAKGYEFSIANPQEAAAILLKHAPELNADLVLKSQEFLAGKYTDDADYWGMQKTLVWETYAEWLLENGFIDEMINVEEAFTNAYLQ